MRFFPTDRKRVVAVEAAIRDSSGRRSISKIVHHNQGASQRLLKDAVDGSALAPVPAREEMLLCCAEVIETSV